MVVPLLVALIAAALLWAAFPPLGVGFLTLPAVGALLWAIRRAPRATIAIAAGATFGVSFFTGLVWWIGNLGLVALSPLVLSQAAYPTLYAWGLFRARHWRGWRWAAAAAGGWALMEYARARLPVGGFSWGMVGYPMGEYAATRAAAQWIGTSGWSVVLVALAAGLVLVLDGDRRRHAAGAAAVAALLLVGGAASPAAPDGPSLRVAVVQGNSPCPRTHCAGERRLILESHLELTRRIVAAGAVDLVVWAESSTGYSTDPVGNPETAALIGAEARRLGAYLLVGSDRPVGDDAFVNANVLFAPDGSVVGEYRKVHPVPFGEYVPLRPVFGLIPATRRVPRDMVRGSGPVVFPLGSAGLGSVISFEGAFARYPREHVRAGADLLVIATNESSYGESPAADQLIAIARMRAAELGVDVIHAAITGRSTLITGGGEVGERTGLYTAEVLTGTVQVRDAGLTLYARWGDWVVLLGALWLGAAVVAGRSREEQKAAR